MEDSSNTIMLSVASLWEIQIKQNLGKLVLHAPLQELVESQQVTNKIEILDIQASHVYSLASPPDYHRDPFDRIIVSQGVSEKLTIITHDSVLQKYPVQTLW